MCLITIAFFCLTLSDLILAIFIGVLLIVFCYGTIVIANSTLPLSSPEPPLDMNPVISLNGGLVRLIVHWRDNGNESIDIVNDSGKEISLAFKDQDFADTSLPDSLSLEAGTRLTIGMDIMPDSFNVVLNVNGGEESKETSRPE